jgi:hypothetical protein
MSKLLLVAILSVVGTFQTTQVTAQEPSKSVLDQVKLRFTLGALDQSGSETLSASITVNIEDLFDKETLNLYASDDGKANLKIVPELTYSITKVELEDEDKTTEEIATTIFSFTWDAKGFEPYLKFKFGKEEIKTTTDDGDDTSEHNTVYIWNPGVTVPLDEYLKLSWNYQLSLEKPLSDKTQHRSAFLLIYEMSF